MRKLTCSKCGERKEVRRYRHGYCGACHNSYVKGWAKLNRIIAKKAAP